jgi:hypothetical protein
LVSSEDIERSLARVLLIESSESAMGVIEASWLTLLLSDVESDVREAL